MNVAVAGVTTKSGISTVIEIDKFSRLGMVVKGDLLGKALSL